MILDLALVYDLMTLGGIVIIAAMALGFVIGRKSR